jgi:hypothetical protein
MVAGIDGRSIDVTAKGGRDVEIFAYPTGNLRVSADARALILVLPYQGADLAFTGFAPDASFEDAWPEIKSVIDTVQIHPS